MTRLPLAGTSLLTFPRQSRSCSEPPVTSWRRLVRIDRWQRRGKQETMQQRQQTVVLTSTLECPHCGHRAVETMPTDACQYFYDCRGCGAVLRPKPGDCCVFCSYGTVACPPIQQRGCCRTGEA
jgi:hypothetical protein